MEPFERLEWREDLLGRWVCWVFRQDVDGRWYAVKSVPAVFLIKECK